MEQIPKISDVTSQPNFHEAFGIGLFKLLMFHQDNGHYLVPSKEVTLYHWLKNQRVYMREYKELQTKKKENPFMRNSGYFYLLKEELGLSSYKAPPKQTT